MTESLGLPGIDEDQLLEAITASSDEAIYAKRLDGTIVSWNRAAEKLYGYTPEEIVGQNVKVLAPEFNHAEVDAIMADLKAGEGTDHLPTVRVTKNGTPIEVVVTVTPVRNAAGKVVGGTVVARHDVLAKRVHDLKNEVAAVAGNLDLLTRGLGKFVTQEEINDEQERTNKRQTRVLKALAVSVLLDVLLSLGLGALAWRAQENANANRRNQKQLVNACQAGNEARRTEQQLWTYVLDLSSRNPQPSRTPAEQQAQQQQIAQFRQYLATVFAQRNCNTVTGK